MPILSYENVISPLLGKDSNGRVACFQYVKSFSEIAQNTTDSRLKALFNPFIVLDTKFNPTLSLFSKVTLPIVHFDSSIKKMIALQKTFFKSSQVKDILEEVDILEIKDPQELVDILKEASIQKVEDIVEAAKTIFNFGTSTLTAIPLWTTLAKEINLPLNITHLAAPPLFLCAQAANIATLGDVVFSSIKAGLSLFKKYSSHHAPVSQFISDCRSDGPVIKAVNEVGRAVLGCIVAFAPLPPIHRAIIQITLTSWKIFDWQLLAG